MSFKLSLFLFIFALCFSACKSDQKGETEEMQQVSTEASSSLGNALPQLSDDDYVEIYEAQELIKIYQDDKSYREAYCQKAYLRDRHQFVSMGIGLLRNPGTGRPIARSLAQRAALLDARRWSAYGETWLKNNFEPPFGSLESYINQPVMTLNESIVGDSLFVFIATQMNLP
jgi:hypothetical protein